jgi:hypothetical protein
MDRAHNWPIQRNGAHRHVGSRRSIFGNGIFETDIKSTFYTSGAKTRLAGYFTIFGYPFSSFFSLSSLTKLLGITKF